MARRLEFLLLLCLGSFDIALRAAGGASKQSCSLAAGGPPAFRQCRLQYYVQVLVGNVDVNDNLLPTLNASFSGPFGHGELFALNLTEGRDRSSKQLGHMRGYTIDSAYRAHGYDLIEVALISYSDGYYEGTIQIQGEILALPASANEVAIVGGTRSFRGARGYALVRRLVVDGPYRLFHHDLHFMH